MDETRKNVISFLRYLQAETQTRKEMEEIKVFEGLEFGAVTNDVALVYEGANGQALTSSLMVARVFGKSHDNVLKAVRKLLEEGVVKNNETPMFAETMYTNGQNKQEYPMFVMNRDGFTLLAMGFTGEKALAFKVEYIRAFNAMEQQIRRTVPSYQISDPIKRAEKWIEEEKERQKLVEKIEEQKPKVEYFDKLIDHHLNINFRDTAKEIGLKQNDFIKKLLDAKYIYRDAKGKIKPYAKYTDELFIIKECAGDGKWAGLQTLITPKGRETFNLLFGEK